MIDIEGAIELLLENVNNTMEYDEVDSSNALGRVLAEDVIASIDNPPFDRSPLDGYALRGEDTQGTSSCQPAILNVIGKVYAGQNCDLKVEKGEAVRIMTGAMIPQGANAIIRQEDTDYGQEQVQIFNEVMPYSNYCYQGEDYKKGDVLIKKNTYVNAGVASVMASTSAIRAKFYKNPGISVIATGDELIESGEELTLGKIYDSNLTYICGRLNEIGLPANFAMHFGDEVQQLAQIIKDRAKVDQLIITTGGVSVGEKDIIHELVDILGAKLLFWKVAIKPGTPVMAFKYNDTLVVSLSGNPFGAVTNFEILVRPVLAKLSHRNNIKAQVFFANLQDGFNKKTGISRFVRGYYEEGKVWLAKGNHSSGSLSSISRTNCLIEIEAEREITNTGELVRIYLV